MTAAWLVTKLREAAARNAQPVTDTQPRNAQPAAVTDTVTDSRSNAERQRAYRERKRATRKK